MAQINSKKVPSRFQPVLEANSLVAYTTHIIANPKYFNEEMQKTIIPIVIQISINIADYVNNANAISVRKSLSEENLKKNYKYRIDLEGKAIEQCYMLKSKINILHMGFHLVGHKARAWNERVDKVIHSLQVWRGSEVEKFKEL